MALIVGGSLYLLDAICAVIIPVHLPVSIYVLGWLWGAGLIYWVQGVQLTRSWHVACAFLALWLLFVYWVPWTTRKTFLRDWDSITSGMHASEVEHRLRPYSKCSWLDATPYCGTITITDSYGYPLPDAIRALAYHRPFAVQTMSYRHSRAAAYNNDVGMVYFVNDRVVCTEFHPD